MSISWASKGMTHMCIQVAQGWAWCAAVCHRPSRSTPHDSGVATASHYLHVARDVFGKLHVCMSTGTCRLAMLAALSRLGLLPATGTTGLEMQDLRTCEKTHGWITGSPWRDSRAMYLLAQILLWWTSVQTQTLSPH